MSDYTNYVSTIKELADRGLGALEYRYPVTGDDHQRIFQGVAELTLSDGEHLVVQTEMEHRNKKLAKQAAARLMLERLQERAVPPETPPDERFARVYVYLDADNVPQALQEHVPIPRERFRAYERLQQNHEYDLSRVTMYTSRSGRSDVADIMLAMDVAVRIHTMPDAIVLIVSNDNIMENVVDVVNDAAEEGIERGFLLRSAQELHQWFSEDAVNFITPID
jgi:hypothetical protein